MSLDSRWPWPESLIAGAGLGVLAQALVVRLNPEAELSPGGLVVGFLLWTTWGAVGAGLPMLAALVLWSRLRRDPLERRRWRLPWLMTGVYLFAAIMSRVNADLHPELLSGTAHRVLRQDAVAWFVMALLVAVTGRLVASLGGRRLARSIYAGVLLLLPLARLATNPTPPMQPIEGATHAVGRPERTLLVLGVEGLDSRTVFGSGGDERTPNLQRIVATGAWGTVRPNRPFLRWSLWTTLATGAQPGRHGVKSDRAWSFPLVFRDPLRLLPWTPQGSRLILPWYLARQVRPPSATLPPLWEWLRTSGVRTRAIQWPGVWAPDVEMVEPPASADDDALLPASTRASLNQALASVPRHASEVRQAIVRDASRVRLAQTGLGEGAGAVWVHLDAVAVVRRLLEPTSPLEIEEREVVGLVLEVVDGWIGDLVAAAGPQPLVAVVSPYGLAPPDGWERLRRLLGGRSTWRASAEQCPDGLLVLAGGPVRVGHQITGVRVPDLAPTLCYLLGLPVAQSMDGRVLVDAIRPEWVAERPMRVVD